MRFIPSADGLERRDLATIISPTLVALASIDNGTAVQPNWMHPAGPVNTITGQPYPNPLPTIYPGQAAPVGK
jgi:hypothetical protein